MKSITRALAAEFLGTFTFIYIGAGVVVVDTARGGEIGLLGIVLAHALAFAIMVTATMNISGGHLNPAITFAMWLAKKIDAKMAGLYVATQLIAAVVAILCVRLTLPEVAVLHTDYALPRISGVISDTQAVAIEALLTLFLVSAFFGTLVASDAPKVGGFGVGLAIIFAMALGGTMTGGIMNPARAFGPSIISGNWQGHLIYWVGPLVGAAVAAGIWGWVLLPREQGAGSRE